MVRENSSVGTSDGGMAAMVAGVGTGVSCAAEVGLAAVTGSTAVLPEEEGTELCACELREDEACRLWALRPRVPCELWRPQPAADQSQELPPV